MGESVYVREVTGMFMHQRRSGEIGGCCGEQRLTCRAEVLPLPTARCALSRPRLPLLLIVCLILCVGLCACSGVRPVDGSKTPLPTVAVKAEHLDGGKPFDLASLRGKVCLVEVWASWCAPCREMLPFWGELHGRLTVRGFEVVALSVDEHKASAKAFVANLKLPFVLVWDRGQKNVARLDVPEMPTSFLVDRQGRTRAIFAGFREADRAEIERQVVALLAEPVTGT